MDIKAKVEEIVKKIMADKDILEKFKKEPVSVVEELVGIDLPNDQLEPVVEAVKAKITADKIGDVLGGIGKLFN